MRKLLSILTIAVIAVCSIFVTGCDSSSLSEDYYTPNINYKGMDFKCYSDGDKFTIVRNDMVYTDFSKFVMEDLNSKVDTSLFDDCYNKIKDKL